MNPNQGAWGGQPPAGINPFSQPPPPVNPYGHFSSEVNTTYVPHAEGTVPSVMPPVSTAATAAAPSAPAGGPAAGPPGHPGSKFPFKLPFTSSTTSPAVSGNIGGPARGPANAPGPSGSADDGTFGASQQGQGQHQDTRPLLRPEHQENYSNYAFYNPRRYRPYFDVDTKEVLWRVGSSFIGALRPNFMQVTQEKPDLYGPFWVATTLVFVTAVCGNYAKYIEWKKSTKASSHAPPSPPPAGSKSSDPVLDQWFTNYTMLSASTGIFYGYVFVVSALLWLVMRFLRADIRLPNMLCAYGYAMTIFIPISFVCIIPIEGMRWGVIAGATVTSGLFLLMNMRERIMAAGPGKSIPLLLVILALHLAVGLVLKLYFFNY